jgi:threonine aldolase
MQLGSKMRFIAAQFDALLAGELWLRYAGHANAMTRRLHERVLKLPAVRVTRPVRCNAIFATLPPGAAERLREHYYYYDYGEEGSEARWMTHWATTPADVDAFATALTAACSGETSSTARP